MSLKRKNDGFRTVANTLEKINTAFVSNFSCLIFCFLVSCGTNENKKQKRLPSFPVVEVQRKTLTGFKAYPSNIEGTKNVDILPKIQGFINTSYVQEGATVQKGELLFELEANVVASEAKAAQALISSVNAERGNAALEVEKLRPLVAKGIIGKVELETAQKKLNAAESRLRRAQNNYESIKSNEDYRFIKSPIDGVISQLPYKIGALVGPGQKTPLTTISKTDSVYAYFSLSENDYLALVKKTPDKPVEESLKNFPKVSLQLSDGTPYENKGLITAIIPHADPDTGTILVKAIFPNPKRLLINGYNATVLVPNTYENSLVVPEKATYERQTITYVYQVGAGDSLKSTPIKIKTRIDNLAVISSGLTDGSVILAEGLSQVKDNMVINPKKISLLKTIETTDQVFQN